MLDKFKKAAQSVLGGGSGIGGGGQEEVDRILSLPITQLRIELKKAFQEQKFTQEQFDDFVTRLVAVDPRIEQQVTLAREAVANREVNSELDIELNTPAKTTLWAAALTLMMDQGKAPLPESRIWKQVGETIGIHNESIMVSEVIAKSMQNDDVTFAWGQPGTWFYHDPKKNHINLDLYMTLVMGFEIGRAHV